MRELGDRAFVLVKDDEGWVNILQCDVYLSIQLINQTLSAEQGRSVQELRNWAIALARTAVGRL